jgi:hypothetical protein
MVDSLNEVAIQHQLKIILADGGLCPSEHVLPAGPEPLLEFVLPDRESFIANEALGPKTDSGSDVEIREKKDYF